MKIITAKSTVQWTSLHTAFTDKENNRNLCIGVLGSMVFGLFWKSADLLNFQTPDAIMIACMVALVSVTFYFFVKAWFLKETSVAAPLNGEQFEFDIQNEQVVWNLNTGEDVLMYENGFRAKRIYVKGEEWYVLSGEPDKSFVQMVKDYDKEICYQVRNLHLLLRKKYLEGSDTIGYLDALCQTSLQRSAQ